jgi:hypothetical protein
VAFISLPCLKPMGGGDGVCVCVCVWVVGTCRFSCACSVSFIPPSHTQSVKKCSTLKQPLLFALYVPFRFVRLHGCRRLKLMG